MKWERYGISAFSILLALIFMASPGWVCCGEAPSGKILPLSDEDREKLSVLGEGVVGKALPAHPLTDIRKLMPLMTGEWVYRITAGANRGDLQTDSIGRSENENTRGPWRRMVGKKYIEYFSLKEGSKLVEVSEADLSEDMLMHYDPPIVLMYDGLKPGETVTQEIKITVSDLADPTREKYRGKLRVTLSYVGAYEVSVPSGRYDAVLLKSTYAGKVGPATIKDFGYDFFSRDTGVVVSLERLHVEAFFFYRKTVRTPKILLRKNP